jgi:hypothetical protein
LCLRILIEDELSLPSYLEEMYRCAYREEFQAGWATMKKQRNGRLTLRACRRCKRKETDLSIKKEETKAQRKKQ